MQKSMVSAVELNYERGRFSKKAQGVIGNIDAYFNYYQRAKSGYPPTITIKADDMDLIVSSVRRLKLDGKLIICS